ncbi:tyrosine-type recombinase/integrase [Asanoa sp. NPDC049518]|uniref:tyrosine-type recombinase/integrase n=1 Tax=unclassified Asanoa TaxID=2685164 RepID=UPI0034191F8E
MSAAVDISVANEARRQVRDWSLPHIHVVDRIDAEPSSTVLELVRGLPGERKRDLRAAYRGAWRILAWLEGFPGQGWQDRWFSAGGDDLGWIAGLAAADRRVYQTSRQELIDGLAALFLVRAVAPSYAALRQFGAKTLYDRVQKTRCQQRFADLADAAAQRGLTGQHMAQPMIALSKILLHTGKSLDDIEAEDLLELRDSSRTPRGTLLRGLSSAWDLCVVVAILPSSQPFRVTMREGQRTTADLVDRYSLRCRSIRDLLVRYGDERRPAMDYSSFCDLMATLAGRFWADLEKHHAGIDSLHLPAEVAQAWKERCRYVVDAKGHQRERRAPMQILMQVRAFYLDIQEWALTEPWWARWAAPSPVRKNDTYGQVAKHRRRVEADMHQRVRDRLPHLPLLVATAERQRDHTQALLAAATVAADGEVFGHRSRMFRRVISSDNRRSARSRGPDLVHVEDVETGERLNTTLEEDRAFWSWAIIETLRHTGVRLEELLEITHLALISYRLPDTGETVPLLQIVPSKSNRERLLLITPELASVLAVVVNRVRDASGRVPAVARYDTHERTTGPALPHLFQTRRGWRREMLGESTVQKLLNATLGLTGLTTADGKPLRYTPHDFRRMFATDAVTGGLPVHIAAKILGHESLTTTQAYLAVFQDEVIRAYRTHISHRRATRPAAEYREPTDAEWDEFCQHFRLRTLELGTCGRPYGTPCNHEHACVRCPMLRVDPTQRPRLMEIIDSLSERIQEAQAQGWLGEVQGLQVSLNAAETKLRDLERRIDGGPIDLGIPAIIGRPASPGGRRSGSGGRSEPGVILGEPTDVSELGAI